MAAGKLTGLEFVNGIKKNAKPLAISAQREVHMHELPTKRYSSILRTLIGKWIANTKDYLVVRPLQMLCLKKRYEQKLQLMRSLPNHTVGNDLARMLDA